MTGRSLQLIFVFILLSLSINIAFGFSPGKCIERERRALLMIKRGLIDEYGHLSSWGNEDDKNDCCKWKGISCSNRTGHVVRLNLGGTLSYFDTPLMPLKGNISSSLLELQHLSYLIMSFNDFGGQKIPEFIGSMNKLRHLDLSYAGFSGRIPYQLGNLSRLQSLNLMVNYDDYDMYADKLEWLAHLSSLRQIRLSYVNLSRAIDWLQVVSELPSLTELQLIGCSLPSVKSSSNSFINSSKTLANIDLSGNNLSNSIYFWLFNFRYSLVDLDLSDNNLRGPIPNYAFLNMTYLLHLNLRGNQIDGISKSFRNLCRLKTLSLDDNNVTGHIHDLFYNLSGCTKDRLEILSLTNNKLTGSLPNFTVFASLIELYLDENRLDGPFPKSFGKLSNLTTLSLGSNQLQGLLPDFTVFSSMEVLDISNNQLNGTLTEGIGQLSKLEVLDVSLNSIEGVITEAHLSNLSKLLSLDLSYNLLSLNFSSGWVPPFQLEVIRLVACKLGPHFPKWLQTQNKFVVLDISEAGILGMVPSWFWDQSPMLYHLNLSHNSLSGMLPDLSSRFAGYPGIDLSSNCFEGSIPPVPPNMTSLILSKNMFSGSISFLCELIGEDIRYLDLSYNQLSGEIPADCWMHWQNLIVLNLANNNFSGIIPRIVRSNCFLQSLHLRNNNLIGEFPSFIENCNLLTVIDLGKNKFSGTIPTWMGGNLPDLTILSLRFNQFHGSVPMNFCNLTKLQILDLSRNNISGIIPECFNNFTAMSQKESSNAIITYLYFFSLKSDLSGYSVDYLDHALLIWKGIDSEYKSTLGLVKSIDLSSNKLVGKIPEEITSLVGLISLNLSRNSLIGSIPKYIGQLNLLNSLDLSKNLLTGKIPESFSQMDSLGVLNLSYNKLSGKIPSSIKLQGFFASTYMGNPELCGSPLPDKCPEEPPQDPEATVHDQENGFISRGFYVSVVLGFTTGFWGVCGTLVLNRSWRYAYFRFLDNIKDKLYIMIAVKMAHFQRQLRS